MIRKLQKTHITVTCVGGSIYTPSPLSFTALCSSRPTKPLEHSFHHSPPSKSLFLAGIHLEIERERFEGWVESTLWACTCSSQEPLEATFDSSIRVCYSWSFAPRRLEVPVSSHSFVVEPPEVCITPSLRENNSKWLNPPMWLIGWGKRVIGQPCSLWAPQRRRSSFVEWTSG